MKVCKSARKVKGCGEEKPLSDFPKTKNGHQSICKACIGKYRRNHDAGIKIHPDTALFNMFNIAWR